MSRLHYRDCVYNTYVQVRSSRSWRVEIIRFNDNTSCGETIQVRRRQANGWEYSIFILLYVIDLFLLDLIKVAMRIFVRVDDWMTSNRDRPFSNNILIYSSTEQSII